MSFPTHLGIFGEQILPKLGSKQKTAFFLRPSEVLALSVSGKGLGREEGATEGQGGGV